MKVDIEALRALCDAATPGPWRECVSEILIGDHWWRPVAHAHYRNEDDAAFIAAAREALPAALAEVERLTAENANMREFIAASKECAEARAIVEVEASNERYRKAFTEIAEKLQQPGGGIRSVLCSWCREQWPQLDGDTPDDVRQHAREHAFRCVSHPMRIERDAMRDQLAAMTEARDKACTMAEQLVESCRDLDSGLDEEYDEYDGIIESLRKVGHQLAAIGTRASGEEE